MVSYKIKILGSVILLILAALCILAAVLSWQAVQKLPETSRQPTICISYDVRDQIASTLSVFGFITNVIVGAVLVFYAIGILLVK